MTSHLYSMMGLPSIEAHDVRTCPPWRRYEAKSEDVTWRRSHRLKEDQTPWTLNIKWHLNDAKDVVTSKVDKVDILNIFNWRQSRCVDILNEQPMLSKILRIPETKRERVAHWLSVFNIVIFYFDNFDMIL